MLVRGNTTWDQAIAFLRGNCWFSLKVLLKYAKTGRGVLNYNTYLRMWSMSFLSLKCRIGNDITRATLFEIQWKRTVTEWKVCTTPWSKVCYMQLRLQSTRLGSFSEISIPIPHLMEINIYRVHYIHYNTGMTSLCRKIKLYISLLFLGSNLIIS